MTGTLRLKRGLLALAVGLSVGWLVDPFLSPPDTAAYFSWGWSAATDADFEFVNEFSMFDFPLYYVWVTQRDRTANDWPIGSGLAWLPAMVPAAWLERVVALSQPTEGGRFTREWPPGPLSLAVVLSWSTLLVLFVLRWSLRVAEDWFGRPAARWAGWATVVGTPLLFYLLFGPFFSHCISFAAIGLFFLLWVRWRGQWTPGRALALGVVVGWMTSVRPQSVLFTLAVPVEEFLRWWTLRKRTRENAPNAGPGEVELGDSVAGETSEANGKGSEERTGKAWVVLDPRGWPLAALMTGGALLAFAPQIIAWTVLYGKPIALPKLEEMHWLSPAIGLMLASDFHGVLPWTPAVGLGLAGLFVLGWRKGSVGATLAVMLLAQVYVNAANEVWWSGGSFGNRRLVDVSAVVLWSLAALWAEAERARASGAAKMGPLALRVFAALACAWTLWLVVAERLTMVTLDHYVPFDLRFLENVLKVWTEPGRLVEWVGSLRGLGWATRFLMAGLIGGGWFAMEGMLNRLEKRKSFPSAEKEPVAIQRRGVKPGLAFGAIAGVFALGSLVFALRTPPVDPFWLQGGKLPRQNGLLATNYMEYGHYLLIRGDPDKALDYFRKAEAVRPGHWVIRRWLAITFRTMGRWSEAAAVLGPLLEEHSEDGAVWREARIVAKAWPAEEPGSPEAWAWAARVAEAETKLESESPHSESIQ